jgi:hypothetical protein
VVAEAPATPRDGSERTDEEAPPAVLDAVTAARVLRALEVRGLRVWAH